MKLGTFYRGDAFPKGDRDSIARMKRLVEGGQVSDRGVAERILDQGLIMPYPDTLDTCKHTHHATQVQSQHKFVIVPVLC